MAIQITTFKGARYIVKFHDPIEWSAEESYEAIESVKHNAFTYISKQPVPIGVQIDNTDFWLLWADPNAQMEELRRIVSQYVDDVETLSGTVSGLSNGLDLVDAALPISEFSAQNTVKDYIDTNVKAATSINPDSFAGNNDYEKLQAAIDYAINNDMATIVLNRKYDITGHTLMLNKNTSYLDNENLRRRKNLTFIGIGKSLIEKNDNGYIFSATEYSGDFSFVNMHFKGNKSNQTAFNANSCDVFNASMLIRIKTFGCFYENLRIVFEDTESASPINAQSINTYGDTVYHCGAYCRFHRLWDCAFDGATIEECLYGFITDQTQFDCRLNDLIINNCCIESTQGAIVFDDSNNVDNKLNIVCLKIQNCYFEDNGQTDILIHAEFNYNINISGNIFIQNYPSGSSTGEYLPIKIRVVNNDYIISGNDASFGSTVTSKFLTFLDSNNNVIYGFKNSIRGNASISNYPARIHTEDNLLKAKPGQNYNIDYICVCGYTNTEINRMVFTIPVSVDKPTGINATLNVNTISVIGGNNSVTLYPSGSNKNCNIMSFSQDGSHFYTVLELLSNVSGLAANENYTLRLNNASIVYDSVA